VLLELDFGRQPMQLRLPVLLRDFKVRESFLIWMLDASPLSPQPVHQRTTTCHNHCGRGRRATRASTTHSTTHSISAATTPPLVRRGPSSSDAAGRRRSRMRNTERQLSSMQPAHEYTNANNSWIVTIFSLVITTSIASDIGSDITAGTGTPTIWRRPFLGCFQKKILGASTSGA
jgi:hypothetical protein